MKTFSIFILIFFTAQLSFAQDAKAILEKLDKVLFAPKDKSGIATIILIDKTGEEKVREAEFFQKGPDKKLYRYTKPESQAGIATLSLPDDVVWLSLPAFENPKRISILSKSQAFNNTDFSYEDMATNPYVDRFIPELTSTGANDYVLQLTPISGKSKYTKIILRMHKQDGYPISMLFYNEQNRMFKEATYTYEKIGKYWNAKEVVMKDIEKDHSTVIKLSDIKFDQGLSDDLFKVENLKK
jgi:outer membrane lipoprotein-sorting protein